MRKVRNPSRGPRPSRPMHWRGARSWERRSAPESRWASFSGGFAPAPGDSPHRGILPAAFPTRGRSVMPGFDSTRRAALLGSALIAAAFARPSPADTPPGPHSLAEAIKMEQDDALPRTAFYATPALSDSKPGALLRQQPFAGYAIPTGAK